MTRNDLPLIVVSCQRHRDQPKTVTEILQEEQPRVETAGDFEVLCRFRRDFHGCLTRRGDALFELTDAVLCTETPVRTLVGLSLAPEHRRGHGALYDGMNHGVLGADVSPWPRPAATDQRPAASGRSATPTARGKGNAQTVPSWPYSLVMALEPGRTSWTAPLDTVRLNPNDDLTTVTAGQVCDVVRRLAEAGHHQNGDPDVLVVFDAGYDATRLAYLLADLPVELVDRLHSDRVFHLPAPPWQPGTTGRPRRHGPDFKFSDETTWGRPRTSPPPPRPPVTAPPSRPAETGSTPAPPCAPPPEPATTARYPSPCSGRASNGSPATDNPHPCGCGAPGPGPPPPTSTAGRRPQAFLRHFDLEHTFRLFKQTPGWTTPKLRDPEAADRWTWLVVAAYTQLRLARTLAANLRRPWERPTGPGRPGPGRPAGSRNRHPAQHHPAGKIKKDTTGAPAEKQAG